MLQTEALEGVLGLSHLDFSVDIMIHNMSNDLLFEKNDTSHRNKLFNCGKAFVPQHTEH